MTDTTPEPTEGSLTEDNIDAIFGDGGEPVVRVTENGEAHEEPCEPDEKPQLPAGEPIESVDDLAVEGLTETEREEFLEAIEELHPTKPERPRVIYSTIDDGLGNEQVVGWDSCGKCMLHIRICDCLDGPFRPSYIEKFAFTNDKPSILEVASYVEGGDMVEGTMHAASVSEKELVDLAPDVSPTGRRRRKDAGKPRKPRDVQATQAAAEDLAQAIKDGSTDG